MDNSNNNDIILPSIGWLIFGLFFPMQSLLLYLVWREDRPNRASMCFKGFLYGFILQLIISLLIFNHTYMKLKEQLDNIFKLTNI